jgi:hypothetical protein
MARRFAAWSRVRRPVQPAGAGGLARPGTIAGALARQEAPACLSAPAEVTTRRATVVQDADTSVLVHLLAGQVRGPVERHRIDSIAQPRDRLTKRRMQPSPRHEFYRAPRAA